MAEVTITLKDNTDPSRKPVNIEVEYEDFGPDHELTEAEELASEIMMFVQRIGRLTEND